MLPKFHVGDVVENTTSRIQGKVVKVDQKADIYTVEFPNFTSSYTRPMLRLVLRAEELA